MPLPPMIRIEVDQMKMSVMHYLQSYHADIEEQVDRQLEAAIANYDFEGRVTATVAKVLDEAIAGYFQYGNGRDAINQAVWDSLDKLLEK